ncbi:Protein serine/threonine phosphatase PrpC, regulation of stationary phase [hydrothermal vent metagenome]|uniref:Protein serine/threonine phosphatase PrpC, regulation of stationary phase n=1 Tax=hydrothermal vent metagenome TaxID=652676 RepID=A0A3B0UFP2_9ZZZZ
MSKTWIIPDVHGCVATLKLMVAQQIKPVKSDRLIFLGDYIDRGPDSKGVIDFIIQLQAQGYNITALKGNHEDFCVKAREADKNRKNVSGIKAKSYPQKMWELNGGKQTLESFGVLWPSEIPEKYIRWMESLVYFVETEKFIAVHAGMNFNLDDPFSDTYSMLWIREFQIKPEKINNKILIHGHNPVSLKFIDMTIRKENPVSVDLDNGIYVNNISGYGNLVVLEINSMEYKVQTVVDEVHYNKLF